MEMISKINKMVRQKEDDQRKRGLELKAEIKKINGAMHFQFWEFK